MQQTFEQQQFVERVNRGFSNLPNKSAGNLRFLQPKDKVTRPVRHRPRRAEELTFSENVTAIREAFYVIGAASRLIVKIWGRAVKAYFADQAAQSRGQRWAQLGTSAMVSGIAVQLAPFIFG